MKIKVTQEDITYGIPTDHGSCPIALALIRSGIKNPSVSATTIQWLAFSCRLPGKAQTFIRRFDTYNPVKPFSFTLNIK